MLAPQSHHKQAILSFESAEFDNRLHVLASAVSTILNKLAQGANDDALQRLLPLKANLAAFDTQITEFKDSLDDFAEDSDHIKRLQLSLRPLDDAVAASAVWGVGAGTGIGAGANTSGSTKAGAGAGGSTSTEKRTSTQEDAAQMFFDDFVYIAEEIENEASQLMTNIRSAEEVLAIELDRSRNRLLNLNLFATTGAFVVGLGSMFASLFGMNLNVEEVTASWNFGEIHQFAFVGALICSMTVGVGMGCVFSARSTHTHTHTHTRTHPHTHTHTHARAHAHARTRTHAIYQACLAIANPPPPLSTCVWCQNRPERHSSCRCIYPLLLLLHRRPTCLAS